MTEEELLKLKSEGFADDFESEYNQSINSRAQNDAAMLAASQKAQKPGKMSEAGDLATTGGVAAANPYIAGAGLAMKAIGHIDDAKRAEEQAKIDAYNKKIMAQRQAVRNMFS